MCVSGGVTKEKCYKGGKHAQPIDPVQYSIWRGSLICAKRMTESYLDLPIKKSERECRSGYKSCGVIDSLKNILCVNANVECPCTKLEVLPLSSPLPTEYNYTKINVMDANMIFSRNNEKGGLNQFIVSEDTPCVNPFYKNYLYKIFLAEAYYTKDQCIGELDGHSTDPKVEGIDLYSFYKVYNENGIINKMNIYPEFPQYALNLTSSSRNLKLYHKGYIGISGDCLNQIKELNQTQTLLNDLFNYDAQISAWYNVSNQVEIFSIITTIFYSLNFLKLIDAFFSERLDTNEQKFRSIFNSIPAACNLTLFIITWTIFSSFGAVQNSLTFLSEQNCLDYISLEAINNALQNNSSVFSLLTLTVISSGTAFIGHIGIILIAWVL